MARHPGVKGPYRRDIVPNFPPPASASVQHAQKPDLILSAIEKNGRTDFSILATADVLDLLLFYREDSASRVPPPPPPSAWDVVYRLWPKYYVPETIKHCSATFSAYRLLIFQRTLNLLLTRLGASIMPRGKRPS